MKIRLLTLLFTFLGTMSSSAASAWLSPDDESLLLMRLNSGNVVIQLSPEFAPKHVANIKRLVQQGYFNGTHILRSQDNYVVQWGDAYAETAKQKSLGKAKPKVKVEFFRDLDELSFVELNSRDAYADRVGFVNGFPVASDGKQAWLAHCYGMVGVSRDVADDSGNGSGLYVVTGHAPRHLDRNVTLVGRVLVGMDLLSSLPRGKGELGFYQSPSDYVEIQSLGFASTTPGIKVSVMDTNSSEFKKHVERRTTRSEEWFLDATGKIELCNVGVPQKLID